MKLGKIKGAFTLIELLVVITIIGILATGGVRTFNEQIKKSRDSVRVTDLGLLRSAVEQYYQDRGDYPVGGRDWIHSTGNINQAYMPGLARDPKDRVNACIGTFCGYVYGVVAVGGIANQAFELSTGFENAATLAARGANNIDTGNDANRLELIGGGVLTINTSKSNAGTPTWGNTVLGSSDTSATIHIGPITTDPLVNTVTGI